MSQHDDTFLVASSNFGGGVASESIFGDTGRSRIAGLAELASNPCGSGRLDSAGSMLLAIQEMVTLPGKSDPLGRLLRSLPTAAEHFTATTSTVRYPLPSKWERRWSIDGPLDIAEGLAMLAFEPVGLRAATEEHGGPISHTSRGRVIDLPILEFFADAQSDVPDDSWLRGTLPGHDDGLAPREVAFRPTYYQGSRDTDPRAASAHVATFPSRNSTVDVVVMNVHMATLRSEAAGARTLEPGDQLAFSWRRPTVEAMYLRHRQFQVLSAFVDWVYEHLRLPIVILGDFNCEPGSPEMDQFCRDAALTPALLTHTCWRCGKSPARPKQRRYTNASFSRISEFADPASMPNDKRLLPTTSDGYCGVLGCSAPLFTHKRNLKLLDNILVTNRSSAVGQRLLSQLAFVPAFGMDTAAGINDTHEFSDHNSIWATLAPVPHNA